MRIWASVGNEGSLRVVDWIKSETAERIPRATRAVDVFSGASLFSCMIFRLCAGGGWAGLLLIDVCKLKKKAPT